MKKFLILTLAAGAALTSCVNPNQEAANEVKSPDGKISFSYELRSDGLFYNVEDDGDQIVYNSRLGFVLADNDTVAYFDRIKEVHSSHDETWETAWGESREVRDNYNQMIVEMRQKGGDGLLVNLEVRVFDDGFAYRYVFPSQGDSLVIMDELTEFQLAWPAEAWAMTNHDVYYEDYYRRKAIEDLDTVHTPVTIEAIWHDHVPHANTPGVKIKTPADKYLAIHEANLTDYPKMQLIGVDSVTMKARLVPWSDGVAAYVVTPFATPWRTMIIGDTPGDLVTSYMMLNLNEPCAIEDASWCKPMKYIGVWWEMHLGNGTWYASPTHGANTAHVKEYIDFAAEHGIPGVLVEGWNVGWEGDWPKNDHFDFTKPYPDFDIKEITDYAAEKGVTLVGHHETAAWTKNYENQLDTAFRFYTDHGVHNVKTGYVNLLMDGKEDHSSQYGVRHYRKVIETAAANKVNIDNHEPVMPTGLQRTWPNLMTQEGVRGQEHCAWDPDGGNPPEHTVLMPFTRGLAGPMDYTFGTFNYDNPVYPFARVRTTLAKELALYVIIYSPMQMASDTPANYAAHPDAFQFIKDFPVDWEKTLVPDAVIGDYVVTVRQDRNSSDWYLGAATDEDARELDVKLDFLEPDAEYTAQIYADAPEADWETNPTAYTVSEQTVKSTDTLPLKLAAGGGTAIRFSKK